MDAMPHSAILHLAAQGRMKVCFNDMPLVNATMATSSDSAIHTDLMGKIRTGKNVLAIKIHTDSTHTEQGFYPLLLMTVGTETAMPKPPGAEKTLTLDDVRSDVYQFPAIKNFTLKEIEASQ